MKSEIFKKIMSPFEDALKKFNLTINEEPLIENSLKISSSIKTSDSEIKYILEINTNKFKKKFDSDLQTNLEKRDELLTELYPFKKYYSNRPTQKSMNYVSNLYK